MSNTPRNIKSEQASEDVESCANSNSSSAQNDHFSNDDTLLENTNKDENTRGEISEEMNSAEDIPPVSISPIPNNETPLQSIKYIENQENQDSNNETPRRQAPYVPSGPPLLDEQTEFDDLPNDQTEPVRHRVEWIYPNGYNERYSTADGQNSISARNTTNDENQEGYVVDPAQTYVTLEVEGVVVPPRRCFIKMFGFELCSDAFPSVVNPKCIPLLIALVCGTVVGIYYLSNQTGSDSQISIEGSILFANGFPSISPSSAPSDVPVPPRVANITQVIYEISGDMALIDGSAQSRALQWILHTDTMGLEYNSTNLAQRYVMMVLFYDLSGEEWVRKEGFGSGKHECEWYGVLTCSHSQTLTQLDLSGNNLRGSLSSEIAQLSDLLFFDVSNDGLTGSIVSEIGLLHKLEIVRLGFNSLTGTIPEDVANCKNLRVLALNENLLSGTIPSALGGMRNVQKLEFDDNQLSGTIPLELGNMRVLRTLYLQSNRLTGTIPPELGKPFMLEKLKLRNNQLIGTIPSSLVELSDLVLLFLDNNMLSGTIPSLLYQLPKNRELRLENNQLTGTIPDFTSTSSPVVDIRLSDNLLNGTIPESFVNFLRLDLLLLQNTDLSGSIPESICSLSLRELQADCGGDDPEVFCSCCSKCY